MSTQFDESKVRRGQPANAGQFAQKHTTAPAGTLPFASGDFGPETVSEQESLNRILLEHFGQHDPRGAGDVAGAVWDLHMNRELTAEHFEAVARDAAYDGGAAGQDAERIVRRVIEKRSHDLQADLDDDSQDFSVRDVREIALDARRQAAELYEESSGLSFEQVRFNHRPDLGADPALTQLADDMATGRVIRFDDLREDLNRDPSTRVNVTDVTVEIDDDDDVTAAVRARILVDPAADLGFTHAEMQKYGHIVRDEIKKLGHEVDDELDRSDEIPVRTEWPVDREGLTKWHVAKRARTNVEELQYDLELVRDNVGRRIVAEGAKR